MSAERLGLGADGRGEGFGERGAPDDTRREDRGGESASPRGAGRSGPERPTLRKARRSPVSRFDHQERLIRDAMIYHDVRITGKSQRFLARVWELTPGRVSQIVKDMRQQAAAMPGGDAMIDQFVQLVRDSSRRSQTEQSA